MSIEITTAFVKQYSANVEFLVQQKGSLLREAVRVESGVSAEEAFFDQIGATAPIRRELRHADTPLISTPHSRRRVYLYPYDWADLIDKPDKLRTLIKPESPYALNAAYAMGRAMDDEIIAAIRGTAYTGKDGTEAVVLPAGQKIAHGGVGLTVGKLLSARTLLRGADVDRGDPLHIAVTSEEIEDLLNTVEVTSADYNTVRALAKGEIDTFAGFKFHECNRMYNDGTYTYVTAWAESGVLLAVGEDIRGRVSERDDKNYSTQVFYSMDIGATRMQEEKVVEIACA